MNSTALSPFDLNSLTTVKGQVRDNDPKALKVAAQQFEALFLQMVLKSMRDSMPREGLFDSDQTRLYESLLDQQLAQVLSTKGGTGLAALIEKQLGRVGDEPTPFEDGLPLSPTASARTLKTTTAPVPVPSAAPAAAMPLVSPSAPTVTPISRPEASAATTARHFAATIWPYAQEASRSTGIPAHFLVAQAALETGWGRSEPRGADGRPSYNLFGIKAGRNWGGAVVEAATTEYVDGAPRQQLERFRAYGSYAEAFRDYAALLTANPRYEHVIGTQDASLFARGLQRAGYATDPAYAAKLERIIGGQTLRTALMA